MSLFDDDPTEEPVNPIGTTLGLIGPTETLCRVHDSLVAYFNQAPKTPDLIKLGIDQVTLAKANDIIFEGLLAQLKQDRLADPRRRFK